MMYHIRPDYNRIQDPQGLIPATEPVFLIRGHDPLGPILLDEYADELESKGGDPVIVAMVREQAENMRQWQTDHPETVHLAGLPETDQQSKAKTTEGPQV